MLVVGPLLLIGGALWLVNRRVTARLEDEATPAAPDGAAAGADDQPAGRLTGDQGAGGADAP